MQCWYSDVVLLSWWSAKVLGDPTLIAFACGAGITWSSLHTWLEILKLGWDGTSDRPVYSAYFIGGGDVNFLFYIDLLSYSIPTICPVASFFVIHRAAFCYCVSYCKYSTPTPHPTINTIYTRKDDHLWNLLAWSRGAVASIILSLVIYTCNLLLVISSYLQSSHFFHSLLF